MTETQTVTVTKPLIIRALVEAYSNPYELLKDLAEAALAGQEEPKKLLPKPLRRPRLMPPQRSVVSSLKAPPKTDMIRQILTGGKAMPPNEMIERAQRIDPNLNVASFRSTINAMHDGGELVRTKHGTKYHYKLS